MLLDSAIIAILIYIFARYNAEGGMIRSYLMLAGAAISTVLIVLTLPESLSFLAPPIYLLLLAAGLTFVCGTQPRQTGKIIGVFVAIRLLFWGTAALILKTA